MFIRDDRIAEIIFLNGIRKAFFNPGMNRLPHDQGVIRFYGGIGGYAVQISHFVLEFAFFKAINS